MPSVRAIRALFETAGIAAIYFVAGKIGLSLAFLNVNASPVWPPTGIALAAFLVLGGRAWTGILLGAFLVNLSTSGNAVSSAAIAGGNLLEGWIGMILVRRYAGGLAAFEQPGNFFRFVLACFLCTTVSSTIGATTLALAGLAPWSGYGPVWFTWWLGDMAGALVLTPALVLWSRAPSGRWTAGRRVEAILALAALAVTCLVVFGGLTPFAAQKYPLAFLLYPSLMWTAFRLTPREASASTLMLSAIAIGGTLRDLGPFARQSPHVSLLLLQSFMAVTSVLVIAISTTVSVRRRVETQIRALNEELEERVLERTRRVRLANEDMRLEIAERRRAQAELERTDARLREAQGVARIGSWEWDVEANTLWWSDELFSIYGLDPGSFRVTYESFLECVHPEDRARLQATVESSLRTGEPFTLEHRIVLPDRTIRTQYGRGRVERDEQGRSVRMMGIGQDITDRKLAEEQRAHLEREQAARRQAEESNRLKDEFLATLSHELRTPLHAIVGWVELLRQGRLDPANMKRAVETIQRNAHVQSQLISDMLDISRMAVGRLEMRAEGVNLVQVVERAIDTMRPAAEARRVQVRSGFDGEMMAVMGDPDRLLQVVWNLLSNAIKFAAEGGVVAVTLERTDGSFRLRVEDDGPGIAPGFLPYVFDRFRQADSSSTRRHGGLGLGLAIVRHLVDGHGGSVTAANRTDGPGARFEVMLPAAMAVVPVPVTRGHDAELDGAAGPDRLRGMRILVVEDEPDSREMITHWMTRSGAEVRTAGSGAEALVALAAETPDVLVSDLELPGENGYDLIRKVRALPDARGRVPAVALTAYADAESVERALESGFQAHVPKPVSFRTLERLLAELAGSGRDHRIR